MKLQHITIENLKVAKLNVRKVGGKAVDDLIPSIRALGVIQPLLVRPNCEGFEVVAGQRRYHACRTIAEEDGGIDPIPCAVMDDGDDAKAIEASLAENAARLPMDEIDQYKAFAALIKAGKTAPDIAAGFGVTERLVTQRLAIANLISPILTAYRKDDDIHPQTLRLLTMATKKQQRDWLSLYKSEEDHAPEGYMLKCWLFGGEEIATDAALFDLEDYQGSIVSDLFGEDSYFADAETFWQHQSAAIAKAKEAYLADGWSEVIVFDIGEHFPAWEYVDTAKEDGGKVYVAIARNGEVNFYEGQLTQRDAQKRLNAVKGEKNSSDKPSRPELTKAMQRYLDLHRHAAMRTALIDETGLALRVAVAQMIGGSALWSVEAEPRKAPSEAITDSLATNAAEPRFAEERAAIRDLLAMEGEDTAAVVAEKGSWQPRPCANTILTRLIALDDATVMRILAFVTAETLPCSVDLVEPLGDHLAIDMAQCWEPDETFFDLLRDKEAINAMLSEIGGVSVAEGNLTATAKVQKGIIRDCLNGTRKPQIENWLPRYMRFPMESYTARGGIDAMAWHGKKAAATDHDAPDQGEDEDGQREAA